MLYASLYLKTSPPTTLKYNHHWLLFPSKARKLSFWTFRSIVSCTSKECFEKVPVIWTMLIFYDVNRNLKYTKNIHGINLEVMAMVTGVRVFETRQLGLGCFRQHVFHSVFSDGYLLSLWFEQSLWWNCLGPNPWVHIWRECELKIFLRRILKS